MFRYNKFYYYVCVLYTHSYKENIILGKKVFGYQEFFFIIILYHYACTFKEKVANFRKGS